MIDANWVKEFVGAVTVCDAEGTILDMNDRAATTFAQRGGRALIGSSVLDCHPEHARAKLAELMATRQPARASSRAMPRPMPRDAPVTRAVFWAMAQSAP